MMICCIYLWNCQKGRLFLGWDGSSFGKVWGSKFNLQNPRRQAQWSGMSFPRGRETERRIPGVDWSASLNSKIGVLQASERSCSKAILSITYLFLLRKRSYLQGNVINLLCDTRKRNIKLLKLYFLKSNFIILYYVSLSKQKNHSNIFLALLGCLYNETFIIADILSNNKLFKHCAHCSILVFLIFIYSKYDENWPHTVEYK